MAKNKSKIKRIKQQQRASYLKKRDKARAEANKAIQEIESRLGNLKSQGFIETNRTVMPDVSKMSASEARKLVRNKYALLSHIKSTMEYTVRGRTGSNAKGYSGTISTGIRASQITKDRPLAYHLAIRANKGASEIWANQMNNTKYRSSSVNRAQDIQPVYDYFNMNNLISNPASSRGEVFSQQIDIKELMRFYNSADEATQDMITRRLVAINEVADMSEEQYEHWRANNIGIQTQYNMSPALQAAADWIIDTSGIWDYVKVNDLDSDQIREIREMSNYVVNKQHNWNDSFKMELQKAFNQEPFDISTVRDLLRKKGFSYGKK